MSNGFLPVNPEEQAPVVPPTPETPVALVNPEASVPVEPAPAEQPDGPAPELAEAEGVVDPYDQQERQAIEQMQEKESQHGILERGMEDAPVTVVARSGSAPEPVAAPVPVAKVQDEIDIEVARILEENITALYQELSPEAQARFKSKGEDVSRKIADMVRHYKVQVSLVLHLIHEWLLTVPGINKFFLEQEAKIKTDRVLEYEDELHQRQQNAVS